jgi:hypothetical protein
MILYEYVSFDSGSRILETGSVAFTRPEFFNDPFDQPAYPDESSEDPAYEKEVRVVKRIKGISGKSPNTGSRQFTISDGRIFYRLPQGSIKEMYFGFRSDQGQRTRCTIRRGKRTLRYRSMNANSTAARSRSNITSTSRLPRR